MKNLFVMFVLAMMITFGMSGYVLAGEHPHEHPKATEDAGTTEESDEAEEADSKGSEHPTEKSTEHPR